MAICMFDHPVCRGVRDAEQRSDLSLSRFLYMLVRGRQDCRDKQLVLADNRWRLQRGGD